jgi:DNA invertase Pin-like site-specific DNA recombinase
MCLPCGGLRLMFQLIGAVAEFERALIQERKEYGLEGT